MMDFDDSFLFYAPNVRVGGGKVLLFKALHHFSNKFHFYAVLSKDLEIEFNGMNLENVEVLYWVESGSFFSWIKAEYFIKTTAIKYSSIFCFHNIPLLFSSKTSVNVYLQNRLIIEPSIYKLCNKKTFLIVCIQKIITAIRCHSVSNYYVQTLTMKLLLEKFLNSRRLWGFRKKQMSTSIKISQFHLPMEGLTLPAHEKIYDFIYPADANVHKNHKNLLLAWGLLAKQGLNPVLALTISSYELLKLFSQCSIFPNENIIALGEKPHLEVLDLYAQSKALIFPSKCESLGLPLLEATQLGLPILASDIDFVWDVSSPAIVFDPCSPNSISEAIKKHLS